MAHWSPSMADVRAHHRRTKRPIPTKEAAPFCWWLQILNGNRLVFNYILDKGAYLTGILWCSGYQLWHGAGLPWVHSHCLRFFCPPSLSAHHCSHFHHDHWYCILKGNLLSGWSWQRRLFLLSCWGERKEQKKYTCYVPYYCTLPFFHL